MINCYDCKNKTNCNLLELMEELQEEGGDQIFEHDYLYNGLASDCDKFEDKEEDEEIEAIQEEMA